MTTQKNGSAVGLNGTDHNAASGDNEAMVHVSVTFRHTESTPALKAYATEKLTHCLKKYVIAETETHVVLAVEKRDQSAEVTLHFRGQDVTAKAVTEDLYSAIDKVVDLIATQIRKLKEKQVSRAHSAPPPPAA